MYNTKVFTNLSTAWFPKCALNIGVGVDMSTHCLQHAPTVQRLTQLLAANSDRFRFRYYSPFVTGHIYYLQTYSITFTRFLSFLCLSVHTSPKYFIVSFSTSSFTSTYPFITPIVLSFSSSTSHVLSHLLLTMS